MEISDYDLIKECLGGNQDSFSILVARYKKLIYSIAYKYFKDPDEINDISQEAFLKIYKNLKHYNPEFKFSTWSSRITVNMCLHIIPKKKVNFVPMEEIENMSRENDTPELKYLEKERSLMLRQAINKLPEKYKQVVILYHQKGASYNEMTQILNQSMSIIKNRLFRARLLLRENLVNTKCG